MEQRKETLSAIKRCRFCLSQDETLTSLYDRSRAPKNTVPLPLKILSCVSVEVFPSDRMPCFICNRCKFFIDMSYDYKQIICRQADEHILQYIQNGINLNAVSWPPGLQKLYRSATKSAPELAVMKTVVESGATVQVTANESDSEEEDDENVYNVKIGDGSEDGSKNARVKVITADKQTKGKKQGKGFSSVSKLTRHVRTHAGDRSYPCKYCTKSFIKSHHYTRHLRLKHRETIRTCRGPFGESIDYRCEQCEDTVFATQDELIYHSAIHATQNLICPLCQEKFENVDEVTAHIKSHVGTEFMCDLCELIFTTKEKLDNHVANAHNEELQNEENTQDESSTEMDEDEDDTGINVKEEDGHMVVEIKKADDFMLSNTQGNVEEKINNTNSEESDPEMTYTELATVDPLAISKKQSKPEPEKIQTATPGGAIITKTVSSTTPTPKAIEKTTDNQTATILKRAEEMKRKLQTAPEPTVEKKSKVESNNTGASDKSLRLLEKELQDLKRTTTRSEVVKTPAKSLETLRNRRPQIHTSTPKVKPAAVVEEKKTQITTKSPAVEKKQPERRVVTKENKEPKDAKANNASIKEDKEVKEKETPNKNVVKNGSSEKNTSEEGVRRSTRPSKIKDYAKMIRDRTQSEDDDDSDEVDEEYKETDKSIETKTKQRKPLLKATPKPATTPPAVVTPAPRKRGRPRKDASLTTPVPVKVKKETIDPEDEKQEEKDSENEKPKDDDTSTEVNEKSNTENNVESASPEKAGAESSSGVLMSPTGQTLKKVPVKALPPGVKPLPLPVNARPMGGAEVCEMQIGKKMVKVQKFVMTKAEVEAMAKKGLVEMKDGTIVLKQGIKLPTSDPAALKTLVGDESTKESPSKKDKAAPTRCELGDEA